MAYGIDELIRAGVPAAVFPAQTQYYQVSLAGKLHADPTCSRPGAGTVYVSTLGLREKDLCARCAQGVLPVPSGLREAIGGAKVLRDGVAALAAAATGTPDWLNVADLQRCLALTGGYVGSRNAALDRELNVVRDRLAGTLAALRDRLEVNLDAWCDAAVSFGCSLNDDVPAALTRRLAELQLPPHTFEWGPRDGAWLLIELEAAVVDTLLAGHGWDAAAAAAQDRADREVSARTTRPPAGLAAVVDEYVNLWRTWAATARTAATDQMCVVVASSAVAYAYDSHFKIYHRLFGPAAVAGDYRGGVWMTGIMPRVVAEALDAHELFVRIAGPAAVGDDTQTLTMLLRIVTEQPDVDLVDALDVARGVTVPVPN